MPEGEPASDGPDLRGLRTLRTLRHAVLHLLVFLERAVTGRLDCGEVNEDVCASVIGGDETKALVRVEPLYGSLSHLLYILRDEPETRALRADQLRDSAAVPGQAAGRRMYRPA